MASPMGSVPTPTLDTTLRVRVLTPATVQRAGLSGTVESTASAYRPLRVSATGPAFGAALAGKIVVTEMNDSTLPVATFTTDMPPSPNTQARVPRGLNAIDETGPDFVTGIVRTTFFVAVLMTHTSPDSTLPTQTCLLSGVGVAVCAPAGSLIVLMTFPLLVCTTAAAPTAPSDRSSVTYASSPARVRAATTSVAPAPTLMVLVTFRLFVLSTLTTFKSKVVI